ncbi:MAG: DinB family protein [Actinomycetota bacterium]
MTAGPATTPTRREAVRILERGRAKSLDLVERLSRPDLTRTGIGGGEWSPKDLLGHLASWEEYALDALAAWERGERAPIDDLQFSVSTSRINRQNVEQKSSWPVARVRREGLRTHTELLAAIQAMTDARWRRPATDRGRRALGARLGAILGGPAGPFRHDESHHSSLRSFVDERVRSPTARS